MVIVVNIRNPHSLRQVMISGCGDSTAEGGFTASGIFA